jgi:hypothetical protein
MNYLNEITQTELITLEEKKNLITEIINQMGESNLLRKLSLELDDHDKFHEIIDKCIVWDRSLKGRRYWETIHTQLKYNQRGC